MGISCMNVMRGIYPCGDSYRQVGVGRSRGHPRCSGII